MSVALEKLSEAELLNLRKSIDDEINRRKRVDSDTDNTSYLKFKLNQLFPKNILSDSGDVSLANMDSFSYWFFIVPSATVFQAILTSARNLGFKRLPETPFLIIAKKTRDGFNLVIDLNGISNSISYDHLISKVDVVKGKGITKATKAECIVEILKLPMIKYMIETQNLFAVHEDVKVIRAEDYLRNDGRFDVSEVLVPKDLNGRVPARIGFSDVPDSLLDKITSFVMARRFFGNLKDLEEVKEFVSKLKNVKFIDVSENDFEGPNFWGWVKCLTMKDITVCVTNMNGQKSMLKDIQNLPTYTLRKLVWMTVDEFSAFEDTLSIFSLSERLDILAVHKPFFHC
jgi:hypothetical protein